MWFANECFYSFIIYFFLQHLSFFSSKTSIFKKQGVIYIGIVSFKHVMNLIRSSWVLCKHRHIGVSDSVIPNLHVNYLKG